MLRPFTRTTFYRVKSKSKICVYTCSENDSPEDYIPVIRKSFIGSTWKYLYRRYIKFRGEIRKTNLRDLAWVKKNKLILYPINVKNNISLKNMKNVIFDVNELFNLYISKLPKMHAGFVNMVSELSVTKVPSDRKTIMIDFINLKKASIEYRYSKLYKLFFVAYRYKDNKEIIKNLPDEIIVVLYNGKSLTYVPLIMEHDYSDVNKALSYLRRFLQLAKEITGEEKVVLDPEIEKLSKEYENTNLVKLDTKTISNAILGTQMNTISKQLNKSDKINTQVLVAKLSNNIKSNDIGIKDTELKVSKTDFRYPLANLIQSDSIKIEPSKTKSIVVDSMKDKTIPKPINDALDKFDAYTYKNIPNDIVDLVSSFEDTDIKLKVLDYKIKELPIPENEIAKSKLMRLELKVKTGIDNKIHKINLKIPSPNEDGSFLIFGNKYTLTKQIFPLPITFPSKHVGKFSSYNTNFKIEYGKMRTQIHISGTKIPLGVYLSYIYGFDTVMKKYKIMYEMHKEPPKNKDIKSYKLKDNLYIYFPTFTELNFLRQNLIHTTFNFKHIDEISENELNEKYFEEFILLYTGDSKVSERIIYLSKIAIDKKTFAILKEKGFPTNLFEVIIFMYEKVIDGYISDRNSIKDTRLRSGDIISHIVYDEIKKGISSYTHQVKQGNKNAEIKIHSDASLISCVTSSSFQLMEYVNPIEEIANKYKVTYAGYKGIPKDAVSDVIRSIHELNYGVVDPIDVPMGSSIGVIQYLTMNQVVTKNGSIVPKEYSENIGSNLLSIAELHVPYISRNEPVRAMMSSNQIKQTTILKNPDIPIVQTGFESVVPLMSKSGIFIEKSKCDGKVKEITDKTITIQCDKGGEDKINIDLKESYSGQGYDGKIVHKPIVSVGQKVKKDEILTSSNAVKNGIEAYGKNLVTAYMFWKGYTFEDGVVIAKSVADKLTSTHIIPLTLFVDKEDKLVYISDKLRRGVKLDAGDELIKASGVKFLNLIDIGMMNSDNLFVLNNKYSLVAPYDGEIIDYEIYTNNVSISNYDQTIINALRDMDVKIHNDKAYIYKGKKYNGIFIKIRISVDKPMEIGDKLTNRGASKGIVCKIEEDKNMPVLPDGRRVELIYNPETFINRTNVGQLFELYTGEIGYQLMRNMGNLPRSKFLNLLKATMQQLDDKYYGPNVYNYLAKCNEKQYREFYMTSKENNGFPIVVPPFAEPSYKHIINAMKVLKIPRKYNVKLDGITKKVPVGMLYVLKQEHMISHKIFARSIGPYTQKTGQPTQGKIREGGQRVGEGDTWALIAWDANNIMKELFGPASDDRSAKQQLYRQIIETGSASLENVHEGTQVSKESFKYLMMGIMCEV